jgi:hypothetical protein
MPQAPSIWAMIRCGPGGESSARQNGPAIHMPCGGRLPAFGLSLRPPSGMGIGWAFCPSGGRFVVIHVVLHNNTGGTGTAVMQYFFAVLQYLDTEGTLSLCSLDI